MTKKIITNDMFAGNFVCEVEPKIIQGKGRAYKRRQVKLICLHCNKHFIIPLHNAIRTKQKTCSHYCYQRLSEVFEGGNEKHPLYTRWLSTKQRCYNPKCNNYSNYGARGIQMADEFKNSFIEYATYIVSLPNAPTNFPTKKQLDRIDNNGNYEKGNLRWVSPQHNILNSRNRQSKYDSKYVGVCWSVTNNSWCARVKNNYQEFFLGYFPTQDEAVQARNDFIIKNNLPHKIQ